MGRVTADENNKLDVTSPQIIRKMWNICEKIEYGYIDNPSRIIETRNKGIAWTVRSYKEAMSVIKALTEMARKRGMKYSWQGKNCVTIHPKGKEHVTMFFSVCKSKN